MKTKLTLSVLALYLVFLSGCGHPHADQGDKTHHAAHDDTKKQQADPEAAIKANLAKLSEEDRKIAEAQQFCAVEPENRLGGDMGVPIKVMVKDQPVFVCCKSCVKAAQKDPDATLKKVAELKEKAKSKS